MSNPNQTPQMEPETPATIDSDFAQLMNQAFEPSTDHQKQAVSQAVQDLATQVMDGAPVLSEDVVQTVEGVISQLDQKLSAQINEILHDAEFKKVESTWLGLHHLVQNTETDDMLKIRVLNVSKDELRRDLKKFRGNAWDRSPLFKKVYEAEFGQLGGKPYGCLVGDYHFDHSPVDVNLLSDMSRIAAAAHAPFLAGAAPSLLGLKSWTQISKRRDPTKVLTTSEYAQWNGLRDKEDSRYVGLCMPRFIARQPYGPQTNPVDEFHFEEETDAQDDRNFSWANSVYAMAANINRSFKLHGWCVNIRGVESGGEVDNLPCHTFPTDDGNVDLKCPTEVALPDRTEHQLSKAGLMPLVHRKSTDLAAFLGAQSLQKPKKYDDEDACSAAELSARLPYMFATSRFAHYLKCMVRDKIGTFTSTESMKTDLQKWINHYVDGDPENSQPSTKAKKPLAKAEVEVEEDPENPGYYKARFYLRPHYQLEGLTVSLRLVSRLPSAKQQS